MITNNLLENCGPCYAVQLSEYPLEIVIKGGLASGVNYIIKATDKFGNSFATAPVTAATDGSLVITIPQSFPQNWFGRNAGSFLVQVSKSANPWLAVQMTFGGNTYTTLVIDFVADTTGINTVA